MRVYLDMIRDILETGSLTPQRAVVNGQPVNQLVVPGVHFNHNMALGFPLLTTKEMNLSKIAAELEFFIKGEHRKEDLWKRGCHIWDKWQQPGQDDPNELGRIYGVQWRRWRSYRLIPAGVSFCEIDQLANLLEIIEKNPFDRRTVVSAWNPGEIDEMALPACHILWQTVTTRTKDGHNVLNLCMTQRSADMMLGVPFNIASYALLLLLLAKHTKMLPGNLSITFNNAHIYEHHIPQAREQLKRSPHILPEVFLPAELDLFTWRYDQYEIRNYKHHPALRMQVAV